MKTTFLLMDSFSYLVFFFHIPLSHSIMFSAFLLPKLLLLIYRISCHCWLIKIVLWDNEQWRSGNKITTAAVRISFKWHFNTHSIVIHIVFKSFGKLQVRQYEVGLFACLENQYSEFGHFIPVRNWVKPQNGHFNLGTINPRPSVQLMTLGHQRKWGDSYN